jgi:alkylation response protein AidB-like acyl-CoA dehydrogenase
MDTSDPAAPKIVHGFLAGDASGYRIEQTWDTLGMRATESNDTILDRAFVPDSEIALVCPAGFAGAGLFQVAVFAWALLGFAHVYAGIARRAYDLAVQNAHRRSSIALTRSMAHHPRGAARDRRDAHQARGDRRLPRARGAGFGRTESTTERSGRCSSWRPSTSPSPTRGASSKLPWR